MITLDDDGIPYPAEKSIIGSFPNSQHRVIMIKVWLNFQLNDPRPIPRWNFRKSNWEQFKGYIEKNINCIPRCISALPRFQKLLFKAAKINIPRGFRKYYLPERSAESEELYKEHTAHQTAEKERSYLPHWIPPGARDGLKRLPLTNTLTWKEVAVRHGHYFKD